MVLSWLLQVRKPLLSSLDGVDLDTGYGIPDAPARDHQLGTVRYLNAAGVPARCENIMYNVMKVFKSFLTVSILCIVREGKLFCGRG